MSTYNRCELLPDVLDSLLNQQAFGISYEIIVVDNNSTDATQATLDKITKGTSRVRCFFEPTQGLSYGWNTGIRQATGSIIALIDDDLWAAPDYVEAIRRLFDQHPEVAFLGGKILPRWPKPKPSWLTSDHWSPLALQDYGERPFYTTNQNPVPLVNKAFRTSVLEGIGLFNTSLGKMGDLLGDVADHELMVRIWRAGGQGIYAPGVVVFANVQEERLTKAYHKFWHTRHGRLSAQMALANPYSPIFRKTVLGAPSSPYRRFFNALRSYPIARLQHDEAKSFYFENRMRYALNYLVEYYSRSWRTHGKL